MTNPLQIPPMLPNLPPCCRSKIYQRWYHVQNYHFVTRCTRPAPPRPASELLAAKARAPGSARTFGITCVDSYISNVPSSSPQSQGSNNGISKDAIMRNANALGLNGLIKPVAPSDSEEAGFAYIPGEGGLIHTCSRRFPPDAPTLPTLPGPQIPLHQPPNPLQVPRCTGPS